MQKARTLALLLVSIACISPAQSQGMMEGTFVRGLGAGMGAGTAASMGHGKVVRRTAESLIQAQQAMIAQTKTIEQYVTTGIQLQAKKQWATAEQYFQEALKVIAKRDGPGSPKSAPVLARLANVAKNQHKLDEAIGYQKTVVAFANNAKAQNPTAAVQAQTDLSSLFIDKGDLSSAEGVLKQSADIVRHDRSIPPKTYSTTLRVYGEVLRKLNKNSEADVIDAELASQGGESGAGAAPVAGTQPAATATLPAVPEAGTEVSTAPPEATAPQVPSESSTATPATAASSSTGSPVATEAAAASSPPASPPGTLLPPPTADWPVMTSDGKIVSESNNEAASSGGNSSGANAATAPASEPAPSAEPAAAQTTTAAPSPVEAAPAPAEVSPAPVAPTPSDFAPVESPAPEKVDAK